MVGVEVGIEIGVCSMVRVWELKRGLVGSSYSGGGAGTPS